jgi:hypothetical protein
MNVKNEVKLLAFLALGLLTTFSAINLIQLF